MNIKKIEEKVAEIRLAQEEVNLAADRDVSKSLEDLVAGLTAVMLQLTRKYKDQANDPALKTLFGKSRKSIDDIVNYLISKKIL